MAQLPSTNDFPFFPYFFPCSRRFCVTSGTFTIKSASIVGNCLAIMQFKRKNEKKNKKSRWLNYPPPMLSPFFPYFFPCSRRFCVTSGTFTIKSASIVGNCLAIMQFKRKNKKKTKRVDGSTTLHQCFPLFLYFFPCSRRFCVTSGTFTIKSASIVGNCLAIMQKQEIKQKE